MADYDPRDAEKACFPAGVYKAHIKAAEKTTSKSSGKPMFVFQIVIHDRQRGENTIWERCVVPSAMWKMKALAEAIGKVPEFNTGVFNPRDYVGANLEVEVDVERQSGYADKNVILEFMPLRSGGAPAKSDSGEYPTSLPETGEDPPF